MCRFVLYVGPSIRLSALLTEPSHSLIRQSFEAKERPEPLNGDGFGVAWYAPEEDDKPALFRSVTPAWNNRNLLHLSRVVRSPCVLAHVRAATATGVMEANCHPFVHRHYAFMHNGDVEGFGGLRRKLLSTLSDESFRLIEGSTDSEHLFAVFLDELEQVTDAPPDSAARLAKALRRTVQRVRALQQAEDPGLHAYINCAVTDGHRAVVVRYSSDEAYCDTLYVNTGRRYVCEDGVCRMIESDEKDRTVIISSEALSDEATWSLLPTNHLGVIGEDRRFSVQKLG
jgi:predicted glutamine amidotransferase